MCLATSRLNRRGRAIWPGCRQGVIEWFFYAPRPSGNLPSRRPSGICGKEPWAAMLTFPPMTLTLGLYDSGILVTVLLWLS